MPIPSTTDLPKPKFWDEFENIVWEIYTRKWQDSHAQRYGRNGQAQNGIDIYGRQDNSDKYIAVQCKCCEDNKLTLDIIESEVGKSNDFSSPISEYIITTTASRNTKIQDHVRFLNERHRSENKFVVSVVFWEDICNFLADSSNRDLLKKYYSEWGRIFMDQPQSRTPNFGVRADVQNLIEIYAPTTKRVEKTVNWNRSKYRCYDAVGSYLGQVKGKLGERCWEDRTGNKYCLGNLSKDSFDTFHMREC